MSGHPLISNTPGNSSVQITALKSVVESRVTSQLIAGSEKKTIHRIFADGSE